jgi:hypothetical protein
MVVGILNMLGGKKNWGSGRRREYCFLKKIGV